MPKFRFELETVLDQRGRVEQEKMRLLGEAERNRAAIDARVREVQARLVAERGDLRGRLSPGGGTVAIEHLRMQATASLFGVVELQRLAIEMAGAVRRVEAARTELLKAAVARKAVEKLKARRLEAWKREQDRRENAELDDLAVMRRGAAPDALTTGDAL